MSAGADEYCLTKHSSVDRYLSTYLHHTYLPTCTSHALLVRMDSTSELTITISHRGTTHPLSLLPDSTLAYLQARLEELTSVPPDNQKLLYKGKKSVSHDATVIDAGLKDGLKVQLIGPTAEELGGLQATESEHQRKERILRERAQKVHAKV